MKNLIYCHILDNGVPILLPYSTRKFREKFDGKTYEYQVPTHLTGEAFRPRAKKRWFFNPLTIMELMREGKDTPV